MFHLANYAIVHPLLGRVFLSILCSLIILNLVAATVIHVRIFNRLRPDLVPTHCDSHTLSYSLADVTLYKTWNLYEETNNGRQQHPIILDAYSCPFQLMTYIVFSKTI